MAVRPVAQVQVSRLGASALVSGAAYQLIPVTKLRSNPDQPRRSWQQNAGGGNEALALLAQSIKAEGILQPLLVTPRKNVFLIVCGERRYRAAKIAKLQELPCIVRPSLDDKAMLELAITENLQREDLSPVDQARAIKALIDRCGYSQRQVASRLGLSPASVNYKLSVLELSPQMQKDLHARILTETQGRAIIQEVRKVAPANRRRAMAEIRHRIRTANEKTLNTQDIRTLAKSSTSRNAPAPQRPRKGLARTPALKGRLLSGEKAEGQRFADSIDHFLNALRSFSHAFRTIEHAARFAHALRAVAPKVIGRAREAEELLRNAITHITEPNLPNRDKEPS